MTLDEKKKTATAWFRALRDQICAEFEAIEAEYDKATSGDARGPSPSLGGRLDGGHVPHTPMFEHMHTDPHPTLSLNRERASPASPLSAKFTRTPWRHDNGGGGEISIMKGRVFEKVGVNISVVHGQFSEQFRHEIPGAAENPNFWAAGISLVAHMQSPHVPAAHMNTRMIVVGDSVASHQSPVTSEVAPNRLWFGGGGDLNPIVPNVADTADFHAAFKAACDGTNTDFYPAFSQWCDEYFFLPHRNEMRGVGGIFYDYLGLNRFGADTSPVTSGKFGKGGVTKEATAYGMQLAANAPLDWDAGLAFTQSVGTTFKDIYSALVRRHMHEAWSEAERHHQLVRRGRYAEYNLLYDRGTRFGLMTGGNTEAILMSLPPMAIWE